MGALFDVVWGNRCERVGICGRSGRVKMDRRWRLFEIPLFNHELSLQGCKILGSIPKKFILIAVTFFLKKCSKSKCRARVRRILLF